MIFIILLISTIKADNSGKNDIKSKLKKKLNNFLKKLLLVIF